MEESDIMSYVMTYEEEDGFIVEMLKFDYVGLRWLLHYAAFDEETEEVIFSIIVPMTTTEATDWFNRHRKGNEVA